MSIVFFAVIVPTVLCGAIAIPLHIAMVTHKRNFILKQEKKETALQVNSFIVRMYEDTLKVHQD